MVRIAKRRRFDVAATRRSNKVYPNESDMSWEQSIAALDHRNSEVLLILWVFSSADHLRGAKTHCRWAVCQRYERGGAALRLRVSPSNGAIGVLHVIGGQSRVNQKQTCLTNSRHVSETLPLLMPSCTICLFSSGDRSTRGFLLHVASCLETLILPN